jgi:hypothetical protein
MTSWIAAGLQSLSSYFGKEEDEEEALESDALAPTLGSSRKKRKATTTNTTNDSDAEDTAVDTHEDDTESKTRSSARGKRQKTGSVAPSTAKLTNMKDGGPDSNVLAPRNADTCAVESLQRQAEDQQL